MHLLISQVTSLLHLFNAIIASTAIRENELHSDFLYYFKVILNYIWKSRSLHQMQRFSWINRGIFCYGLKPAYSLRGGPNLGQWKEAIMSGFNPGSQKDMHTLRR